MHSNMLLQLFWPVTVRRVKKTPLIPPIRMILSWKIIRVSWLLARNPLCPTVGL